jgi:hypothetical protein
MNIKATITIASLICLAVLPELGGGGVVRAGFTPSLQENTQPHTDWDRLLPHLMRDELPPAVRKLLLQADTSDMPLLPMPGTGSGPKQETPGGTPPSSSGGSPIAGLWSLVEVPADRPSALLFLDECSMREHSLSSRLFRPPRLC